MKCVRILTVDKQEVHHTYLGYCSESCLEKEQDEQENDMQEDVESRENGHW